MQNHSSSLVFFSMCLYVFFISRTGALQWGGIVPSIDGMLDEE
jgi:hypothetical protein